MIEEVKKEIEEIKKEVDKEFNLWYNDLENNIYNRYALDIYNIINRIKDSGSLKINKKSVTLEEEIYQKRLYVKNKLNREVPFYIYLNIKYNTKNKNYIEIYINTFTWDYVYNGYAQEEKLIKTKEIIKKYKITDEKIIDTLYNTLENQYRELKEYNYI